MKGYHFDLTCPTCSGELVHITSGAPSLGAACAIAECVKCRREISIHVSVTMRGGLSVEHGTERGYQQHRAEGTDPCPDCRQAKSAQMKRYKARHRAKANA